MRRIAQWAVAGAALVPLTGCATFVPSVGPALAATAPGSSYAAGKAVQDFPHALGTVRPAVLAAFDDLQFRSVKSQRDAGAVLFEGTTADGQSIVATLRPHQNRTRMTVRIGWFGDEPLSTAVLDRVNVRLGGLPPSAAPADPPSAPAANPFFSRAAVPDELMLREQAEARFKDVPSP